MSTIKDGYKEAVVFALYNDGKLLIERRPENNGDDVFIPNGGIEEKDKDSNEDYRVAALKREAFEEMGISISNYDYLMEVKVDEINVWFYVYLVNEWKGQVPNHTVEFGKKFADLEWIDIRDYKKVFKYPAAHLISEKIIERFNLN